MRKFGILFLALISIFAFFAGFYFYYVPANKENLDKYAFLILQNIHSDLENKITADISMLENNLKKYFGKHHSQRHNLDDTIQLLKLRDAEVLVGVPPKSNCQSESSIQRFSEPKTEVKGQLYDISNSSFLYLLHNDKDTMVLSLQAAKLINGILQAHQNDFFQSFLFFKVCHNTALPVFKSDGLSLGADIPIDSFLTGGKGAFYPGIADMHLGDLNYKMFYIPVNINDQQIVLCGLKRTSEYMNSLHEIPPGFIYPIVIILLLMLIILPLIKLYIMGPEEKVNIWDFAGFIFSLFVGSMVTTIILIQVILLKDGDIRMEGNLTTLSKQIGGSFKRELLQAYRQLQALDRLPEKDPAFKLKKDWRMAEIDVSKILRKYVNAQHKPDSIYYNFDRVAWEDRSGMQIIKGELDKEDALFIDVSKRKYFSDLANNRSYRLPGTDTANFTMEPLFNWTNGDFRIILAKWSECAPAFITSLSTSMYSVNHTILPKGFGFCLIDPDGNVQVHSDSSHNLNENFFDELENAGQLKAAIASRQELFINDVKFYGKKNGLLITPVSGLPFFLVTFYDKGYILPVNMRILIFSLLFFFMSFFICLLVWLVISWRMYYRRPLLFTPMDYLHWVIPKKKYTLTYFAGFLFLLMYIAALLLIIFLPDFYTQKNNHLVLILLLLTPINISCGLVVIGGALVRAPQDEGSIDYAAVKGNGRNALITLCFLIGATILGYRDPNMNLPVSLIVFQGTLLLFLCCIYFSNSFLKSWHPVKEEKYLLWYTFLNIALVVCLSALPAGLFTWYSHNHEILQEEKKEQLFLAFSLENRKNSIYNQLQDLDKGAFGKSLFDTLQYARGIYSFNEDSITLGQTPLKLSKADSVSDKFYFEIADRFSNDYYDPQSLPALQESSADYLWQWGKPKNGYVRFAYVMPPDIHLQDTNGQLPVHLLNIQSKIPPRYIYLNDPLKRLILLIGIAIILLGLYKLIRRISEGIFLQKFIQSYRGQQLSTDIPPMVIAYCLQEGKAATSKGYPFDSALFDYVSIPDERFMNQEEYRTILNARTWEGYYSFVFTQCSPKNKYLLYNFAKEGFLNYKNVTDIYQLLNDGILKVKNQEIRLFCAGFRAYIVQSAATPNSDDIEKTFSKVGAWESFKRPFMLILFGFAALIFFTQQDIWQRISALVTGLTASLPLLTGLFRSGSKTNPPSN